MAAQHIQDGDTAPQHRPCVGIMILDAEGRVWIGQRADVPGDAEGQGTWWQMPQGGIDPGEDAKTAALRELFEETGIRSAEVIAELPGWLLYDLPPWLQGKAWGGRFRGQKQRWFAVRFTGDDSEIDISPPNPENREFRAWRWAAGSEVLDLIVPFKRDVYAAVMAHFAPLWGDRAT